MTEATVEYLVVLDQMVDLVVLDLVVLDLVVVQMNLMKHITL
jgi:hypothetical protein